MMFQIGLTVLVGFVVAVIARQSAFGGLNKRTMWCESYYGYPHTMEQFPILVPKSGDPVHEGPENSSIVYEARGFMGRGTPRAHYFKRGDIEILPAPQNKKASHPMHREPKIRIWVSFLKGTREAYYANLRETANILEDEISLQRDQSRRVLDYREELTDDEISRVKKWKDAVQPPMIKKTGGSH